MVTTPDVQNDRRRDLQAALPDVSTTLYLDGLEGTIDIYRDRYGIPHVRANSTRDAFFGQGLATAQDRLWHMDADRHQAFGRWAEFVGQSGVAQDVTMRKSQIGPTAKADYQDLYVEQFNPDNPAQYAFQGEWKQAEVRRETIQVKGDAPVKIDVIVTHHGPIIGGDPGQGKALAFKYTATAALNRGFESILQMLSAANAGALDESMRDWVDPCNNFVFADVHSNIGYLNRGKVPIRSIANAWLPVPGWTGEHEWQGDIPFEVAARLHNPDTGFIVTANNRIVGHDYPYYLSLDNAPEYRARRILDRLQPLTQATVEDMRAIHAERVSIPAQVYMRWIAEIEPQDALSASAKERLSTWDCSMDADAVAPTIYSAFRGRLMRLMMQHLLGDALADEMFQATGRGAPVHMRHLATRMTAAAAKDDASLLPPGQTWTSIVAQALAEGLTELKVAFGDDLSAWVWGKVHKTMPKHILSSTFPEWVDLLDPPAMSLGGDFDTPLAGSYAPGGSYTISGTSLARYVFDTADWDNSRWIVPLGASGHPGSAHYADQTPIWAEVDLIPMTYQWDAIEAGAESHQSLKPKYIPGQNRPHRFSRGKI